MLLLKLAYLCLPGLAFLGPADGFFLANDDRVSTAQEGFNFFLVRILDGRVHHAVLLILAVQVEDHLCQLGDLLGHLVVSLFVHFLSLQSL